MSMKNLYGIEPGEVWWSASDIGWVVGHSYIVYGPLLHGATTILYEGKPVGTPDAGAFWRVIAEHGAVAMFTAPTAFRAIKKEDPQGKLFAQHDMSNSARCFSRANAPIPIRSSGPRTCCIVRSSITGADRNRLVHRRQSGRTRPASGEHGSPTVAMPGYDIRVVDEGCKECRAAPWARSWSSCRCRPARSRRCGSRMRG